MIEKEFGKGPLNDGLKKPNDRAFHHTVLREDLKMVYGIFESSEDAELERESIRKSYLTENLGRINGKKVFVPDKIGAEKWRKNSSIMELREGQEYNQWGENFFTHGVDDGTHGSIKKDRRKL